MCQINAISQRVKGSKGQRVKGSKGQRVKGQWNAFKTKPLTPLLLAASAMWGCGLQGHKKEATLTSKVPYGGDGAVHLGNGFFPEKAALSSALCVEGEVIGDQLPSSHLNLLQDATYNQLFDSLSGKLKLGVNFPSVKVEAGADYAATNASSEFKKTFTTFFESTHVKSFRDVWLPTKIQMFFGRPSVLHAGCGSEYVSAIHMRLGLSATLNIEFLTKDLKEKFGGMLKVNVADGLVTVDGKLEKEIKNLSNKVRVTLDAKQFGGRSNALPQLVSAEMLSCYNKADVTQCAKAFEAIINYQKTLEHQVANGNNYHLSHYITTPYSQVPNLNRLVAKENPVVSEDTQETRAYLERELKDIRLKYARAQSLEFLYKDTPLKNVRDVIAKRIDNLEENKRILAQALSYCYENPFGDEVNGALVSACSHHFDAKKTKLVPIDHDFETTLRNTRCEDNRLLALKLGHDSQKHYEVNKRLNWEPIFINTHVPEDGVFAWVPCQ